TLRSDLLSRGQSAASQDVVAIPCRGLERRRRARTRERRFEAICFRGGRAQRRKTSLLCPAVGSSAGGALERGGDASKRSAFEGAERSVARRRCNTLPWSRAAAAHSNAEATLRRDVLSRGQRAASQDVVAGPCRGLERPRRSNAGATLRSDLLSREQSAASQDVVAMPDRGLERPRRARTPTRTH